MDNYVKDKNNLGMVNGFYIEAETGILKHSMIANQMGNQANSQYVNQQDITTYPAGKKWADYIRSAGVEITPDKETKKGLFGETSTKDVLKVDIAKLKQIASAANPVDNPSPNPNVNPGTDDKAKDDNKGLTRFRELINKAQGIAAEGLSFKSLIGQALLAELKQVAPVNPGGMSGPTSAGTMYGNLTADEVAEGDKLAQSYGDSQDPEIMNLLKQWSQIKNGLNKGNKGTDDKKKDPVKPTPSPVKPTEKIPPEWTKVKVIKANEKVGYGPNGQGVYILGDGTPKRTFAYYRQENMTLVPMNVNQPRQDLPGYTPIPWKEASTWGPNYKPTQPGTDDKTNIDPKKYPGMKPGGNPQTYALQQQLQKLGAKNTVGPQAGQPLATDGLLGPNTQAAQKQFAAQLATKKEDIDAELPMLSTEPTLARIVQLTR